VNAVPLRVSEVLREPLVRDATSFLLVHNHPSGDPRPSAPDVHMTKEILAAAKLLDIELVDHVVIGAGKFVSMRDAGYATFK
jgi:DNA repair protein RadC